MRATYSGGVEVNGATAELRPLGNVQTPPVHVHIRRVKLGDSTLHATEVTNEAPASVNKHHERVDVGPAPLAPDNIIRPEVHHWDVGLIEKKKRKKKKIDEK